MQSDSPATGAPDQTQDTPLDLTGGEELPPGGGEESIEGVSDEIVETAERVWTYELFRVEDTFVTVGQIVIAFVALIVGAILAKMIARYIGRRLLKRLGVERGPAAAIQSIVFYVLLLFVALIAMQIAAVPMTVFTIAGGAIALGIGFGSQNIVNNFISGLILLIERPISVGETVEVNGNRGRVEKIGARSTLLQSYQGPGFIVPNSMMLENIVTNWDFKQMQYRSIVPVGVAYGSPVPQVMELLERAAREHEHILDEPPPGVLFRDFADSALLFEVHSWMRVPDRQTRYRWESDLRCAIDALFRENGIVIAFPQRDVHLDTQSPLQVTMVGPAEGGG